jgi:hypothetical protein
MAHVKFGDAMPVTPHPEVGEERDGMVWDGKAWVSKSEWLRG